MNEEVSITLEENDPCVAVKLSRTSWGQIIDGLTCRAEQYELTAMYHSGASVQGEILEVRDADEARDLAQCYHRLVLQIRGQLHK